MIIQNDQDSKFKILIIQNNITKVLMIQKVAPNKVT